MGVKLCTHRPQVPMANADKAKEAAMKRSKKKGKSSFGYYIAIGTAISVTVLALLLAATGGSGKKRSSAPSALDALVNEARLLKDVDYKTDNFTVAASSFFDKWTLA